MPPVNTLVIGQLERPRCHRKINETPSTSVVVVTDLKVVAYAKGADSFTDIRIDKVSGLSQHCWLILDGRAKMFSFIK